VELLAIQETLRFIINSYLFFMPLIRQELEISFRYPKQTNIPDNQRRSSIAIRVLARGWNQLLLKVGPGVKSRPTYKGLYEVLVYVLGWTARAWRHKASRAVAKKAYQPILVKTIERFSSQRFRDMIKTAGFVIPG